VISNAEKQGYDFKRLERVFKALIEEHHRLRDDNTGLRDEVRQSRIALRTLEGQLLDANQKRQDVAKRIDELIAQIDQLDHQFANVDQ